MKFLLLFALTIFFGAASHAVLPNRKTSAAAAKTVGVSAPLARQTELIFGLALPVGNTDGTPAGVKSTLSGFALKASYAYGIADFVSVYAAQEYSDLSADVKNPSSLVTPSFKVKSAGISDTTVGVKGVINFEKTHLYYDGSYVFGIADKPKSETSGTTVTESAVSTRPKIVLTGGGGFPIGYTSIGALLTYTLFQDGEIETSVSGVKTSQKNKSGTGLAWKVYGQLEMGWKAGLSYEEYKTDEYNVVTSGVSTITKDSTDVRISAYGIVPFGSANEFMIEVSKLDNKEATTTKYNLYNIFLTYRKIF